MKVMCGVDRELHKFQDDEVIMVCRTVKELPIRACRAVAFSHGGHLFAAVNVSTVCIYNSLTCAQIGVLRYDSLITLHL